VPSDLRELVGRGESQSAFAAQDQHKIPISAVNTRAGEGHEQGVQRAATRSEERAVVEPNKG
jgi:hypothetical protein